MPVINDTVIGKLNPITKIAAVFALGLSALAWPDFTLGLILVVLLLVVSFLAHIQRDFAKIMFGFGIPVTVMLMFIQGLYSPKNRTALLDFGFAQLGLEGVLYAAKVVVSLLVFLGSFYIMNKTTYVGAMVSALTSVGLSAKVGYLVLASLNVVPQMQRRMAVIQEAQSARGLDASGGVIARIKAVLRRTSKPDVSETLVCGNVALNIKGHSVTVDGKPVELTLKEFELLKLLMQNPGVVLNRDTLLGSIWGYDFDGETRTVDVHIRTLRCKLGEKGDIIETVRGVGYKIGNR